MYSPYQVKSRLLSYPAITLDNDGMYALGLIDFVTYNTIPNVDSSNNKFHYKVDKKLKVITLPEGSYEIEDIRNYINSEIKRDKELTENVIIKEEEDDKNSLLLSANLNTQKCEIKWKYEVDFTQDNSIGKLLGFEKIILKENMIHISNHPINIFKVNVICVDCNLVTNSYTNDKPMHTIHMFYPTVPPGYKIVEHPINVIYLPINTREINEILLKIADQDGNPVNFKKELVTIRLHLKKIL